MPIGPEGAASPLLAFYGGDSRLYSVFVGEVGPLDERQRDLLARMVRAAREGPETDRLYLGAVAPDAAIADIDHLRSEQLIAVTAWEHGGQLWRVTPLGFTTFEARAAEEWGQTLGPSPVVASPLTASLVTRSYPPNVSVAPASPYVAGRPSHTPAHGREWWFDNVPRQAPAPVRRTGPRTAALTRLREVYEELAPADAGPEPWSTAEAMAITTFALPGLQLAIEALELGNGIVSAWAWARDRLIVAWEKLWSAKAVLAGFIGTLGSLAAIAVLIDDAMGVIHKLLGL